MAESDRRAHLLIAIAIFIGVLGIRAIVSETWRFGPQDALEFSEQPYGFQVDESTPPFFLMWARGDGQAFLSLSADLDGDTEARGLSNQSYRMGRIGMALAARVASAGQRAWLPYGLAVVSITSYGFLVILAYRLSEQLGVRGLALALSPAAIIGTLFDTAEGMATLLATVSISGSGLSAILAAAFLGITRPSFATSVFAGENRWTAVSAILAAVSLQIVLVSILGIPISGAGGNITVPLAGYVAAFPEMDILTMASAGIVLTMAALLAAAALSRMWTTGYRVAAGASALLGASIGSITLTDPLNPLRVTGALFLLLVLQPMFQRDGAAKSVPRLSEATT